MSTNSNLTENSMEMFKGFCIWAPEWNDQPVVEELTPSQKGYLADIVKKGYGEVILDDGCGFFLFTEKGAELAQELGFGDIEVNA